jgi:hypothetical protein
MPVIFNGFSLTPAPLVTITKQLVRDEGGRKLHTEYTFTLNGTIVNVGTNIDSPAAASYDGMEGILAEQTRIRNIFADGGRLEISSPNGGGPNTIDAYCTLDNINFDQGVWFNRCNYTIVLKAPQLLLDASESSGVTAASENWSINENDDGSYSINHSLNAVGALFYTVSGLNNPLIAAKAWCQARSFALSNTGVLSPSGGTDNLNFTQLINPLSSDTNNFWNFAVVESVGNTANSWQLSESFIHNPSGNTIEEFNAAITYDSENQRKITVTANGSIKGLADRISNKTTRMSNAKTKFQNSIEPNLYTRLNTFIPSNYTLSPIPITKQINYEENVGDLRYSYAYHAASGTLISNAIEENISISDTGTTDIFAQIQVPGRTYGPVVQNMKTVTLPERTVSISVSLIPNNSNLSVSSLAALYATKPNTDAIIAALKPNAGYYYVKQDSEDWNPLRQQYGRTVSWVIQPEGQSISGIPSAIRNTEQD